MIGEIGEIRRVYFGDPIDEDRKEIERLTYENENIKARIRDLSRGSTTKATEIELATLWRSIRKNEDTIKMLDDHIEHIEHYGVPHPG